jgi:hypothetical protein
MAPLTGEARRTALTQPPASVSAPAPEVVGESLDPRDPLLRLSTFFDDGSVELLHEPDRSGVLGTAMSTSAPPGGTASQQRLHRLGFLREGLNPATAKTRPPTPPNGLLHPLQRGSEGR